MIKNNFFKAQVTMIAVFLFSITFAQMDGNSLQTLIGKSSESPEIKNLESAYHCKLADPSHYVSDNDGVELLMKDGILNEIRLYKNSAVYGQFKADLPKGLKFGLSPGEVKALLGKPTVSYNSSGYCEFVIQGVLFACAFDSGKLNWLTLSKNP